MLTNQFYLLDGIRNHIQPEFPGTSWRRALRLDVTV